MTEEELHRNESRLKKFIHRDKRDERDKEKLIKNEIF